jgi:hypothetical protein
MENLSFQTPVVIYAGLPTKFHLVSNVSDASDFLFDNWADNDSLQWTDAMNRCAWASVGRHPDRSLDFAVLSAKNKKAAGDISQRLCCLFREPLPRSTRQYIRGRTKAEGKAHQPLTGTHHRYMESDCGLFKAQWRGDLRKQRTRPATP